MLATALLAAPASATTFRVDAGSEGSTIVRRPCTAGPCCHACHAGQPAAKSGTPKHDRALYAKYRHQPGEGRQLEVRGRVT